jgi:hypothetical protein
MSKIIIVSNPLDLHADSVAWAIRQMGGEVLFVRSQNPFSYHTFDLTHRDRSDLLIDGVRVEPTDRVWLRRPYGRDLVPPPAVHPADFNFAQQAAASFYEEILQHLSEVPFCVSPSPNILRADLRSVQLRVARDCGLQTIDTLISNDPASIYQFVAGRRAITKPFTLSEWVSEGSGWITAASEVSQQDISDTMPTLPFCPSIFQDLIVSDDEIRITIVGNNVFAASIGFSNREGASLDWRRSKEALAFERISVPETLTAQLLQMLRRLGLRYGAFDFIRRGADFIFVELNPAGQWLMMDRPEADMPIIDCFAKYLLSGDDEFIYDGRYEYTIGDFFAAGAPGSAPGAGDGHVGTANAVGQPGVYAEPA